jgi:hypothetical protein
VPLQRSSMVRRGVHTATGLGADGSRRPHAVRCASGPLLPPRSGAEADGREEITHGTNRVRAVAPAWAPRKAELLGAPLEPPATPERLRAHSPGGGCSPTR